MRRDSFAHVLGGLVVAWLPCSSSITPASSPRRFDLDELCGRPARALIHFPRVRDDDQDTTSAVPMKGITAAPRDLPQIGVTHDIDARGILYMNAAGSPQAVIRASLPTRRTVCAG